MSKKGMERHKIPLWLARLLKPGANPKLSHTPPSDLDVDIVVALLAGASPQHIRVRFGAKGKAARDAVIRVRDAYRSGETPERLKLACPWFERWMKSSTTDLARRNGQIERVRASAITTDQQAAIRDITERSYPPLNLDDPDAIDKFLKEAKLRFALAAGPLSLRRTAEAVVAGEPAAITEAREFLYGSTRGPTFAFQQNFGPESSGGRRTRSGDSMADIILKYEKDHPEETGETTIFQDTVLEEEEE